MRSPAVTMAWELWGKNRTGILMSFGVLLAGLVPSLTLPADKIEDILLPLSAVIYMILYFYLLAIFTYPEFQLRNPRAGFPIRKFTLPIRTRTLVGWHMVYGIVAVVGLWMAMYLLIWGPAGIEPEWWILPLLALSLVWMQAICWTIPRLPILQFVAMCVIFSALRYCLLLAHYVSSFVDNSPLLRSVTRAGERTLTVAIFSMGAFAVAYLVAVLGVTRVRHGMNRRILWRHLIARSIDMVPRWRGFFSSEVHAQFWYEMRRKGILFLPGFAIVFLAFVTLVATPFASTEAVLEILCLLAILLFIAAFCVGYGMGKANFWGNLGFNSWDAVRPVSSGFIALSKIRAATAVAFGTWLLLFLVIPGWLWILRRYFGSQVFTLGHFTLWQICTLGPISFLALFAITWGQMAGGLCLALTRREWIVNGVAFLSLAVALAFLVSWRLFSSSFSPVVLWTFWTWTCSLLVGLKLAGAAWFLWSGHRRGLVRWKEIVPCLVLWCLGALSLIMVVGVFLLPIQRSGLLMTRFMHPLPPSLAVLLAILTLPLMRITAAPVAVAWSRHE